MDTAYIEYLGELRCEATHLRSKRKLLTDAPLDNQGKGGAFSPTDLLCTSLATCMMTLMGIAAREKDIALSDVSARVVKHMASGPRRVVGVEVHVRLSDQGYSDRERAILEHAARTCPVAMSIHPGIDVVMTFTYAGTEGEDGGSGKG